MKKHAPPASGNGDYPNQVYAWYVVGVLTVAYIFSFVDRQIINLLVDPIREDLNLTDTQISLLQGIAFALFYTLMGIPIARLADVSNRRAIIATGVFLWSLMTALCGLAKSFGQLFAARIGVGVGEAALSPPSYSLFSDYFPPGKVTRAIAVFTGGSFLGAGLAYIIGGYVVDFVTRLDVVDVPVFGQIRAWQMAFIVVGLPGILLALLVLSLREPVRRGLLEDQPGAVPQSIPIKEIIAFLRKNRRTYGHHMIGVSMFVMLAYAILAWTPAFFIRKYGWTPGEVGLVYGSMLLVFGTSGVVERGMDGGCAAPAWLYRRQPEGDHDRRTMFHSFRFCRISGRQYMAGAGAHGAVYISCGGCRTGSHRPRCNR